MTHLLLSHLSKENNHPELVRDLSCRHAGATEIIVASRHEETPCTGSWITEWIWCACSPLPHRLIYPIA